MVRSRRGGGAPFLFHTNISRPLVAEVIPGSPVPARSGDAGADDVLFDCLALCFPCVLQIGGPRGEKGQKGEPAIIEPVRTTWVFWCSFYFPRKKVQGMRSVRLGALSGTAGRKISHGRITWFI